MRDDSASESLDKAGEDREKFLVRSSRTRAPVFWFDSDDLEQAIKDRGEARVADELREFVRDAALRIKWAGRGA